MALQGGFLEHIQALKLLKKNAVLVRLPDHLEEVDGLIIPGGESTTIRLLMRTYGLDEPLCRRVNSGMPVWGTCAGLIVLSRELTESRPRPLGLLDVVVRRNAFGRQVDSFEQNIAIPVLGDNPFRAVFIRAPIVDTMGPQVEVLSKLNDGRVVAVRQRQLVATAFHPELTSDLRFHQYFANLVETSLADN